MRSQHDDQEEIHAQGDLAVDRLIRHITFYFVITPRLTYQSPSSLKCATLGL
jgi:hypothetical protein